MYDICHPTYYNMSQLGCNDQVKLTTAFYIYMELCEVKRYYEVDYKYCEPLQLFYLQAKKNKNASLDTFVPWPAIHNITLDIISNILNQLGIEKFTFVFKEGDTTSVYYDVCSGIVKPTSHEETKKLKQKEAKKSQLEREIKRNTANLYERALSFDNDNTNKSDSDSEQFFTAMNSSPDQLIKNVEISCDNQGLNSTKNVNSCNDLKETEIIDELEENLKDLQKIEPTEEK